MALPLGTGGEIAYDRPMRNIILSFVTLLCLSACGSEPIAVDRADSALDAPEVLDAGARDDSQSDADDVVMFDAGPLGMDAAIDAQSDLGVRADD